MTSPTETILARRPLALAVFLALAFGLSWLALLPVIVGAVSPTSTAGKVFLPLVAIGSPGIAGFAVAALFAGRTGVSALLHAGRRWRVRLRWYAVVVLLPLAAYSTALVAQLGATGDLPAFDLSVEVWIAAVVSGLLAGTLEEFGWSGIAFPALLARFGLLVAGTAMGVVVALWHLPLFFIATQPQSSFSFLPSLLTLMAVRILVGWVYVGTGGSVLLCLLFHAAGNAWSEVLPVPRPDFTGAWAAETAVFTVAAVAVLLLEPRARWRTQGGLPTAAHAEASAG
jgi:membrane protease YdiL (CAAX protease family)